VNASLFPTDNDVEELLVGPDSIAWRFASDARLHFVSLYPLLLQVAHPTVGAGVRDYSDFDRRPWDRLMRTLDYVNLLIYGGRDAIAAGRRLRALHKGFQGVREDGRRYYALEPDAYAWVHATLLDAYVAGHAQFGRPMRPDQIERFYREYRGLGRLIGVRDDALPADWAGFRVYFNQASGALVRTESFDRVLTSLGRTARPPLPIPEVLWRAVRIPAARVMWLGGIGLMSPALRGHLGLPWSPADQLAFDTIGAATRSLDLVMPRSLKEMGPGQLRRRAPAIARGPLGNGAGADRASVRTVSACRSATPTPPATPPRALPSTHRSSATR
jgi:uncharacterized protein (DUF2236 family)